MVNLTDGPVSISKNARPVMADVGAHAFSTLVTFAPGKGGFDAGGHKVTFNLKTGEGSTVVLYPSGSFDQTSGEMRKPGSANVKVVSVAGDASASLPQAGIVVKGPTSATITNDTQSLSLTLGDYAVGGETVKIEKNCAYTFLFVPYGKKLHIFLMLNTPNTGPVSGAAAAA